QSIPLTLTHLRLDGLKITRKSFEQFLKNCHAPLHTLIIRNIFFEDFEDCVPAIINFADTHKTLKLYGDNTTAISTNKKLVEKKDI
ncbi:29869_t:CDS:1, partial [Racocetra persica]